MLYQEKTHYIITTETGKNYCEKFGRSTQFIETSFNQYLRL